MLNLSNWSLWNWGFKNRNTEVSDAISKMAWLLLWTRKVWPSFYFQRDKKVINSAKHSSRVTVTVALRTCTLFFSSPSLELFHFDDSSAFYLWHHQRVIWSFLLFKLIQNVCSLFSVYSTTSTYLYTSDRQITPTVTPCWNRWTFARFMTNSQKRKEVWRNFIARVPRIPSS